MSSNTNQEKDPVPPEESTSLTENLSNLALGNSQNTASHRLSIATDFNDISSAAALAFQYNSTVPEELGYPETIVQGKTPSPEIQITTATAATPRTFDLTATPHQLIPPQSQPVLPVNSSNNIDSIILSAAIQSALPSTAGADKRVSFLGLNPKANGNNSASPPTIKTPIPISNAMPSIPIEPLPPMPTMPPMPPPPSTSTIKQALKQDTPKLNRLSISKASEPIIATMTATPEKVDSLDDSVINRQSIQLANHRLTIDPALQQYAHIFASMPSAVPDPEQADFIPTPTPPQRVQTLDPDLVSALTVEHDKQLAQIRPVSMAVNPVQSRSADRPLRPQSVSTMQKPTLKETPPPLSAALSESDHGSIVGIPPEMTDTLYGDGTSTWTADHEKQLHQIRPVTMMIHSKSKDVQHPLRPQSISTMQKLMKQETPPPKSAVLSESDHGSVIGIPPERTDTLYGDATSTVTADHEKQAHQIRPVTMMINPTSKEIQHPLRPQSISTMQKLLKQETPPPKSAALSDSDHGSVIGIPPERTDTLYGDTVSALTTDQEKHLHQIRPVSMAINPRTKAISQPTRPQSVSTMQKPMIPETPPSQSGALSESELESVPPTPPPRVQTLESDALSALTASQERQLAEIRPQSVALDKHQQINIQPFRPQSIALMQTPSLIKKGSTTTTSKSNLSHTVEEHEESEQAIVDDRRMSVDPNLVQYAGMIHNFDNLPAPKSSGKRSGADGMQDLQFMLPSQSQPTQHVSADTVVVADNEPVVVPPGVRASVLDAAALSLAYMQQPGILSEKTPTPTQAAVAVPYVAPEMPASSSSIVELTVPSVDEAQSDVKKAEPVQEVSSEPLTAAPLGVRDSVLDAAALSLAYMQQPGMLPSAGTPTPKEQKGTIPYVKSEEPYQDTDTVLKPDEKKDLVQLEETQTKTPSQSFLDLADNDESEGSVSEESEEDDAHSFVQGTNEQLNVASIDAGAGVIPQQPPPGPPVLIDPATGQAIQPILVDPRTGQPLPPAFVDPQTGQTMYPILIDPQTGQQIQPVMVHPFTGQPIQPVMIDPQTGQVLEHMPPAQQVPSAVETKDIEDEEEEGDQSDEEEDATPSVMEEEQDVTSPQPPPVIIARDMRPVANLFSSFSQKFYCCGFVYKKNELNVEGKALRYQDSSGHRGVMDRGGEWSKWWMELWGPVLHLWRVPDDFASFPYTGGLTSDKFLVLELDPPLSLISAIKAQQEAPIYINITNAVTELFPQKYSPPPRDSDIVPLPPTPYSCFFGLSNAGSNLLLFACSSPLAANSWVSGIRLVSYEMFKLHQAFTFTLLAREEYRTSWNALKIAPFATFTYRGDVSYEGPLQMKTHYSNQWKDYYVVLTSKVEIDPFGGLNKKGLFGKKQKKKPQYDMSKRGIFYFFESKADMKKGKPPVLILDSVKTANVIWPEKAELVEQNLANMGQLEGMLRPVVLPDAVIQPKDQTGKDNASVRSGGSGKTGTSTAKTISESERGLVKYENGFPVINSLESLYNILDGGSDPRPAPASVLILAPSGDDLVDWLIAIMGAFSVSADPLKVGNEVMVLNGLKDFAPGNALMPNHMTWPTTLYFSVPEVSGLTMLGVNSLETRAEMIHVFDQKVNHAKQGKLRIWCEAVSKGEWERRVLERKAVEMRLKQMYKWIEKIQSIMTKNGIVIPERRIEDMMMNQFLEEPEAEGEIKESEDENQMSIEVNDPTRTSVIGQLESRASRHLSVTMNRNSVRNSILSPGAFIMEALEFVKETGPTSPADPDGDGSKPAKPTRISRISNKRKSRRSLIPGPTKAPKKKDLLDLIEEDEEGEGSVSESENSSEGSLSANEESDNDVPDNEEMPLGTGVVDPYQVFDEVPDRNSDGEEVDQDDDIFQFYGEKTLLGDLAQNGRNRIRGPGPLVSVPGEAPLNLKILAAQSGNQRQGGAKVEQLVVPGSLLDQSAAMAAQRGQILEVDGPLLGRMDKKDKKVVLQGGLLGEMSRREEEKEYWKKMGYRGPIRPGFMPPMPGVPPMGGMYPGMPPFPPGQPGHGYPPGAGYPPYGMPPPGMYGPMSPEDFDDPVAAHHREALRLQALEAERAKERQRMAERGLPAGEFDFGMYNTNSRSDASSSANSSERRRAILEKLRAEEESSSVADSSDDENPRRASRYRRNSSGTEDDDDDSDSDSGTDSEDSVPVAKAAMQKRYGDDSDEEEDSEEDEDDEDEETDSSSDEPLGSRAGAPPTMGRSQVSYNTQPSGYQGQLAQPPMPGYYGHPAPVAAPGYYGQQQTQPVNAWGQPQMGMYGQPPLNNNQARFSDMPMAPLPPGPIMANSSRTIAARRESLEKSKGRKRQPIPSQAPVIQPPKRENSRAAAPKSLAARGSTRNSQPLSAPINYDSEEGSQSDDSD